MVIQSIIDNLALTPFLYTMMGTKGQKVFEAFEILPERLIGFLLELHYVFPHEGRLMDGIEFLKKDFYKIIPRGNRTSGKIVKPFLSNIF